MTAAVDAQGNIYIAENGRVRKRGADGFSVHVAGSRTTGFSGDGGPATSAELGASVSLAVDRVGNLYIADHQYLRIRKVDVDGIIQTIAGNGTSGTGGDGGPATAAQFSSLGEIAVDSAENLYVADPLSHRVRRITPNGTIDTFAGNGLTGFSADRGPATAARVQAPEHLAVDAAGNLYIANTTYGRIHKVTSTGTILTVAGNGKTGFSGDGRPATEAQLNHPTGIAVDGDGNLYIADSGNYRIRKVSPDGIIRTVAGSGTNGQTGDGGPALSASLGPLGELSLDGAGNVFATEFGKGMRLRKITPQGTIENELSIASVSPPKPVSSPNPAYSDLARMAHYEGRILMTVVVDQNGRPEILHTMGGPYGLDDNATQTIQQWTFRPGLEDANPVPVRVAMEVTFRLLK
ncbi:MAG TPA: energy transducer TonB [Terriglobia bacterium]|nr:energy transducer TonB [Terriglobia bacterium]